MLLVAAAIVLSGLFAAKLAWDTRPITPEDLATAKAQAAINAKDRQVQADLKACRDRPEEYFGAGGTAEQCAEAILPRPSRTWNAARSTSTTCCPTTASRSRSCWSCS